MVSWGKKLAFVLYICFLVALCILVVQIWSAPSIGAPWPRPVLSPAPAPSGPEKEFFSAGDSLTYGQGGTVSDSYRGEVSRLANKAGILHHWVVAGYPGQKCEWFADNLGALIDLHDPDVVFLNCGTNDTPADDTEAEYRTILSTLVAKGVPAVVSYIGYPDMRINAYRPDIDDTMHATNAAIGRAVADYPQFPVADFRRIPANPEWLLTGTPQAPDGVHLTARAEAAYGQGFWDKLASLMGWKTMSAMGEQEMCGLSGGWHSDPWPTNYRPCLS